MKARLLAGDPAEDEARWALDAGAAEADSPIGRYAAALAYLVLGEDEQARVDADAIRTRDDFPRDVGDALSMIAAGTDAVGYVEAVESVLESFETRTDYLEDVAVADTVLVLQALAERRDLHADLESELPAVARAAALSRITSVVPCADRIRLAGVAALGGSVNTRRTASAFDGAADEEDDERRRLEHGIVIVTRSTNGSSCDGAARRAARVRRSPARTGRSTPRDRRGPSPSRTRSSAMPRAPRRSAPQPRRARALPSNRCTARRR